MIWITGLLIAVIAVQHWQHSQQASRTAAESARERARLLDRIQHPERVQIEAREGHETPDIPKDAAELAAVGTIVPEFVRVGGDD
jgi:hypothetical protein